MFHSIISLRNMFWCKSDTAKVEFCGVELVVCCPQLSRLSIPVSSSADGFITVFVLFYIYFKSFCLVSADIILISIKTSGMPKSSWQPCMRVCDVR